MKFESLLDLITKLNTEAKAIAYFIHIRWNGKIKCPYSDCHSNEFEIENNKIYHFSNKKEFKCSTCKKRFSYKTGTFIENSKVPMRKWLMAMYIFIAHKKGISSCQLGRDLKVRQATAWFMLQRLREMAGNTNNSLFTGINEADECYIGGKEGNKHSNKKGKSEKAVVFGILNRDNKKLKLIHTEDAKYSTLGQEVVDNIATGSTLITDEYAGYTTLGKIGYTHKTVNHSAGEYVKKDNREAYKITTNGIEGVFSLLKRGLNTYHWISKKHLQKYLSEFQFRFDVKEIKLDFDKMLAFSNNLTGRLKYRDLIA